MSSSQQEEPHETSVEALMDLGSLAARFTAKNIHVENVGSVRRTLIFVFYTMVF